MPSSSHQSKRPYAGTHSQSHNQSTITSYFHSTTSGTPHSAIRSPPQAPPPPSTPLLPASVQSNLLNVGMRVRKSVPEGYKTGTFSGFSLFSDNSTVAAPMRDVSSTAPPRRYGAPRKELTPFCGIMKVGGLAQQTYTADIDDDVPAEDDLPFLSSQGSMLSDASTPQPATPAGHKRRFSDDDEEEVDFDLAMETWTDDAPSPKSQPVARGVENRALAQPRSRRVKTLPFQARGEGGEEMAVDFEDAEFLDYGAWRGEEVVMRDV